MIKAFLKPLALLAVKLLALKLRKECLELFLKYICLLCVVFLPFCSEIHKILVTFPCFRKISGILVVAVVASDIQRKVQLFLKFVGILVFSLSFNLLKQLSVLVLESLDQHLLGLRKGLVLPVLELVLVWV